LDTVLIELTKRLNAGDPRTRAELRRRLREMARALNQIVSGREQRTAQLGEAELRFHALIEQPLVGISVTTYDRFVYLNDTVLRILGYAADDLLGRRSPRDLVHPGDWARVTRNLERRIAGDRDADVGRAVAALPRLGTRPLL
jgi:PAS domain S-box-containing protein